MAITDEVLNELLKDYQKPEDLLGQNGLLKQLQKRLLEKAMGGGVDGAFGLRQARPGGEELGQLAQRDEPQDAEGRVWQLGAGDAAGSQRELRAADCGQGATALRRV